MIGLSRIRKLWRRIPRSFKRQFVLVTLLFAIVIVVLVLLYPHQREPEDGVKEPATMYAEVFQYQNNAFDVELQFYPVGNRTNMLFRGWSWEKIPVLSGNYDIVIDHYFFKQEFYNITVKAGENQMRFNVPAGVLLIETSFAETPSVVQMEVYASQDRVHPIVLCPSNQRLIIPPGEYDVRFVWEGNEEWLEGLTINDGQVLIKSHQLKKHAL